MGTSNQKNQIAVIRDQSPTRQPGLRGAATDVAYERLLQIAKELGANQRLPPVRTLLDQLHVSRATLDAALSRLERQRILLRRERSGVFVAPQLTTRSIALICSPEFFLSSSPYWNIFLEQAHDVATQNEVRLQIAFTDVLKKEERGLEVGVDAAHLPDWLVEDIQAGRIHGALCVGQPRSQTRWIEAQGVPVVAAAGAANLNVNTERGAVFTLGVDALVQQGCRRICLWRDPEASWWDEYNRFINESFTRAVNAYDIPAQIFAGSPCPQEATKYTNVELGWDAAMAFYGPESDPDLRPDGVLSFDDVITQGALMAFQRLGLQPGREMQVATYANKGSAVLRAWQDCLYRIEYDLGEVVKSMFELLDVLIEGGIELAKRRFTLDQPKELAAKPDEFFLHVYPRLISPAIHGPEESNRC